MVDILNSSKNYLCKKNGGKNISPHIKWNKSKNTISYALIFEDPDAVNGTFIHWYIPYISYNVNELNSLLNNSLLNNKLLQNISLISNNILNKNIQNEKINIIQGKNSLNEFGYHGPCAPEGTGTHRYILTIFSLNKILPNIKNNISIDSSNSFINLLKKNKIIINSNYQKIFYYKYGDEKLL
jgi:Raf kinase inhibitor-like YbhB/YbcL family protein